MGHIVSASRKSSRPEPLPIEIVRLQCQIRRLVCSASWFDCCWNALQASKLPTARRVSDTLDRLALYPPGGAYRKGKRKTLMRRCKQCDVRWYPPQYVRSCGLCEDCVAALNVPLDSTLSPTTEAIRRLEVCKIRLTETRLPAEDEASLRREIEAYLLLHPNEQSFYAPVKKTKNLVCDLKTMEMS